MAVTLFGTIHAIRREVRNAQEPRKRALGELREKLVAAEAEAQST
ncbi:MAG: hypothetical protein ACI9VS_002717 [Candidatus Binatia bacterium]|jgi:hypothetical protein